MMINLSIRSKNIKKLLKIRLNIEDFKVLYEGKPSRASIPILNKNITMKYLFNQPLEIIRNPE